MPEPTPILDRPAPGVRLGRVLDGTLDVAVASFAVWTVLKALAMWRLPLPAALVVWGLATLALAVWRARAHWVGAPDETGGAQTWAAAAIAACLAALSSIIARPDYDDGFYVVQSTWIADHGAIPHGDFIFTNGQLPALYYVRPDFAALSSLHGALGWAFGIPGPDVAYRWYVPVATFGASWATWRLLRAWRVRRPLSSLLLTTVFLLFGGYAVATWGNMHLVRMWQGKATFVSLLVPLLWAAFAAACDLAPGARGREWRRVLGWLVVLSTAGVGLTQTAVFVVPLAAGVAALAIAARRRPLAAAQLVAATSIVPLASGLVVALSPSGGANNAYVTGAQWAWGKVVANWPVAGVLIAAALVVIVGALRNGAATVMPADRQRAIALGLVGGLVLTVPPVFAIVERLTGGDTISYRVAWLLPVPAMAGLLASLPAPRPLRLGVPAGIAAALVLALAGQPIWSAADGTRFTRPGAWKVRDEVDLSVARWIAAQHPSGRYLAGNWLAMATGMVTSTIRPVASRTDYLEPFANVSGAQADERLVLQQIADSADNRTADRFDPALAALDDLQVDVACVAWDDDYTQRLFTTAGFTRGITEGPWGCWLRDGS